MEDEELKLIMMGDSGMDSFIYVHKMPEKPSNLNVAWKNAVPFNYVYVPSGANAIKNYATKIYELSKNEVRDICCYRKVVWIDKAKL